MSQKHRVVVLVAVGAAIMFIFAAAGYSRWQSGGSAMDENAAADEEWQFTPTADPLAAFAAARDTERPILLEFYSPG